MPVKVPKTPMNDLNLMNGDKLVSFIEVLLRAGINQDDDKVLSMCVKWLLDEGVISEDDLADAVGFPRKTVRLWVKGKCLPNKALRALIYVSLVERIKVFSRQE